MPCTYAHRIYFDHIPPLPLISPSSFPWWIPTSSQQVFLLLSSLHLVTLWFRHSVHTSLCSLKKCVWRSCCHQQHARLLSHAQCVSHRTHPSTLVGTIRKPVSLMSACHSVVDGMFQAIYNSHEIHSGFKFPPGNVTGDITLMLGFAQDPFPILAGSLPIFQ